jgi:RHS repeat-associated protein
VRAAHGLPHKHICARNVEAKTVSFYDRANQLTSDGTTAYSYDASGNRNMAGYQTGTANRTSNDGTYTYTYDNAGNLVGKAGAGQTWTFGYDNLNHLTSLSEVTATGTQLQATYTYDVQGKRVQQDVWSPSGGLVTTRYAYDGDQAWAELSSTNVVQTRYLWGYGQTQLFARTDTGVGLLWEETDHLGSVRDVVSADGTTVLDHVEYGGYGTIASETNSSKGGSYLYTALRQDRATGIVWADNRTLLVTTGQWMQEDPIQFGGGDSNLRRYVSNSPTNEVDPSGLQGQHEWHFFPGLGSGAYVNGDWEFHEPGDRNIWRFHNNRWWYWDKVTNSSVEILPSNTPPPNGVFVKNLGGGWFGYQDGNKWRYFPPAGWTPPPIVPPPRLPATGGPSGGENQNQGGGEEGPGVQVPWGSGVEPFTVVPIFPPGRRWGLGGVYIDNGGNKYGVTIGPGVRWYYSPSGPIIIGPSGGFNSQSGYYVPPIVIYPGGSCVGGLGGGAFNGGGLSGGFGGGGGFRRRRRRYRE